VYEISAIFVITFRTSRRPREMYCGHAHLCVCLSVCLSAAACLQYCRDPDVTWGSGRGCPLVVHYWADLQSVRGLCCYGNITEMCVCITCPIRTNTPSHSKRVVQNSTITRQATVMWQYFCFLQCSDTVCWVTTLS